VRGLLRVLTVCLLCLASATWASGATGPVEQASLFRPEGLPVTVGTASLDASAVAGKRLVTIEPCETGGLIEPVRVQGGTAVVSSGVEARVCEAGQACSFPTLSRTDVVSYLQASEFAINVYETSTVWDARVQTEVFDPGARDVSRLLALAKAGQWPEVAAGIERLGASGKAVLAPLPVEPAKPLTVEHLISGTIKPSADREEVEKDVKRLLYWSLTPPIMKVTGMDEDWQRIFDTSFDIMGGRVSPPIVEFCLQRMSTKELLLVPAFVQRYHGRYHSLIVTCDFYDVGNEVVPDESRIQAGAQQVALTMEFIRRADPSAQIWLAVGYNSRPQWADWLKTQDPSRFAGIALIGSAAVRACSRPEVAKIVVTRFRQDAPDKPIALIGLSSYYYNTVLSAMDDRGIIELRDLAMRLKASGFAFVSIQGN